VILYIPLFSCFHVCNWVVGTKSSCALERYSYVGVFEKNCDSSYFWAMVRGRGPKILWSRLE